MNRFSQKARVSKGFSTCSENNIENIFNYLQDVTQPIAKSEMSLQYSNKFNYWYIKGAFFRFNIVSCSFSY